MKTTILLEFGNVQVIRAGDKISVVKDGEPMLKGNPDREIFLQMAINQLNANIS